MGGLFRKRPRPASRIVDPIRGAAQRFAYVGFVVAAFGLMMLGEADVALVEKARSWATDAVAPILGVVSRPVATTAEVVQNFKEIVAIRKENARLREQNQKLIHWQAAARKLEAENKSFKKILNFVPEGMASYVTGRVIGDSGGAFARSLIFSAGARDGVRKGQAVVAGAGLVGRVTSVGRRASRVLLIVDMNSRIPVVLEGSRVRAILIGNNKERAFLSHLPPDVQVTPGERVVTSGHAGAFPPGLPVGLVSSVSDKGILVEPYVKRQSLEYVRVADFGLRGILNLESSPAAAGKSAAR